MALEQFETASVALRGEEPLPGGRFDARHYRAIHRHLFQDVYRWAGQVRSVRITREGSTFCYPENIRTELEALFAGLEQVDFLEGLNEDAFAEKAAGFWRNSTPSMPFGTGMGGRNWRS